jgi:hypothetical protein
MDIDFGVEYFIKTQAVTTFEDDDYYDYNWRIGISVLDMGINQYKYGTESQAISGIRADVSDSLLDEKFRNVNSLGEANDTLRTVVQSMNQLFGNFTGECRQAAGRRLLYQWRSIDQPFQSFKKIPSRN